MTHADPGRSRLAIWFKTIRPATLFASLSPVLIGSALALGAGVFDVGVGLLTLLGAVLLQIGSNLVNDLYDMVRGADTPDRLGPPRAAQQGWLTPRQLVRASVGVFAGAFVVGVALAAIAGWPVVAIGLAGLLCAWAYTGGPFPLGYHGLGDPTVFIFFGPAAVCGTWWVHAQTWSNAALIASLPVGMIITAILVVNNLRDRHTDAAAGKRTLAVRMGELPTRLYLAALVLGSHAVVPVAALAGAVPWTWCAGLASAPMALWLGHVLWRRDGAALNPLLGATARLGLFHALALSVGILL